MLKKITLIGLTCLWASSVFAQNPSIFLEARAFSFQFWANLWASGRRWPCWPPARFPPDRSLPLPFPVPVTSGISDRCAAQLSCLVRACLYLCRKATRSQRALTPKGKEPPMIEPGQIAPEFTLPRDGGGSVSLAIASSQRRCRTSPASLRLCSVWCPG